MAKVYFLIFFIHMQNKYRLDIPCSCSSHFDPIFSGYIFFTSWKILHSGSCTYTAVVRKKKIIKRTYHSMDNLMIINNMSKLVARTIIWHYKRNFVSFLVLFTQVNEPLQPHPTQKKYPYDTTLNSHELLRQSDTKHLFILYVVSRLKNP